MVTTFETLAVRLCVIFTYVGIPVLMGFIPAIVFRGFRKHDKTKTLNFRPTLFSFWSVILIAYFLTGLLFDISYDYENLWDQRGSEILSAVLVACLIPYSIWPIFAFVVGGKKGLRLGAFTQLVSVLFLCASLTLNIVFWLHERELMMVICAIHYVLLLWFVYLGIVLFLVSRDAELVAHFQGEPIVTPPKKTS